MHEEKLKEVLYKLLDDRSIRPEVKELCALMINDMNYFHALVSLKVYLNIAYPPILDLEETLLEIAIERTRQID